MTSDIIVLDDVLPSQTQRRFAQYVSDSNFDWCDYNHVLTAGMYFKDVSVESDLTMVPSDALVKLAYYNDFRNSKIFDQTLYWLGIAVLDDFSHKTGVQVNGVMRMKINNQGRSLVNGYTEQCCNEIHVDNFEEHRTLVYYINDSDGDTILFDKLWNRNDKHYSVTTVNRVSPKRGRAVCFNGLRFHAPSNPIYNRRRYVLNINFF
jgi:hypothetical protein